MNTDENKTAELKRLGLAAEIEHLGGYCKALENPAVVKFDRNKHLILRIDGHKFSTYTRSFPSNSKYIRDAMQFTTKELMKKFNAVLGYTQHDLTIV